MQSNVFRLGSLIGSGAFCYAVVLSHTGRDPANAKFRVFGAAGGMAVAVAMQFFVVMVLHDMTVTFQAEESSANEPVWEITGLVTAKAIGNTSLPELGEGEMQCGELCSMHMNWSVVLLLCNMLLSLVYMLFALGEYWSLCKRILAAKRDGVPLTGARPLLTTGSAAALLH
eukprot:TRINITY_DN59732_c0_g1_i2.p1 TRINITY_DN59732_c0_g1~~TRINITY_DN59732_c0_g1_i2.p1  ORF type:complete len:171 (+),score=34.00 TRINITY_DN59732_c0_g1_i2:225-737(+)